MNTSARWAKLLSERQLEEKAKKRADNAAKDLGATDLKGFKRLLINQYGSVVQGWRWGMDESGDGKVCWSEFVTPSSATCHLVHNPRALQKSNAILCALRYS